jgi:tripartite-type tricarboxylate transporter receptor subunit TctC
MRTDLKTLRRLVVSVTAATLLLTSLSAGVATAQDTPYFDGKTISVVIHSTPGGEYDFYGRLVARYLGKYIPGNPDVIAVNRPGAGGLVATNYMYEQGPSDGTEILITSRELALAERLGSSGVRYKTLEMPPIGSAASVTRVWLSGPDSSVRGLDELAAYDGTFRFAVSGRGAGSYQLVELLQVAGYPVQNVTGYEGTGDQVLAVLRGEADGSNHSYGSAFDIINEEGFNVVAEMGNHPDVADNDDVRDFLTGENLALANVLAAPLIAGRPFFTAPRPPEHIVEILRRSFRDAMADPELIAEAERADRLVAYSSPDEMTELYEQILSAPDAVVETFHEE